MKVYVISVRYVETVLTQEVIQKLDRVMSGLGDWYRLNGFTWLLATDHMSNNFQEVLRNALEDQDSVIILKLDLSDYSGWAQKDVWDWLKSKMTLDEILRSNNALASSAGRNALIGKK